ncbi:MAG: adenylate kinase, partial [Bacteroidales bacterium]
MMINIIIAGPPGSGKGTQAKEMVEAFGFVHLSTGDMLRREIQAQSELGKEVESIMARGDLVSDDIVIRLISENVKNNPGVKGFLYDGFPRTIAQAEALDAFLNKLGHPLDLMLVLDVDDKLCEERLLRRAAIENRADDMDAGRVRHRLATY